MAVDRLKYDYLKKKNFARYQGVSGSPMRAGGSFEENRERAERYGRFASYNKAQAGMSDDNRRLANIFATDTRQIKKDYSLRGNDYKYGTKDEVNAQHRARYRQIRRAFGMSAG